MIKNSVPFYRQTDFKLIGHIQLWDNVLYKYVKPSEGHMFWSMPGWGVDANEWDSKYDLFDTLLIDDIEGRKRYTISKYEFDEYAKTYNFDNDKRGINNGRQYICPLSCFDVERY